MIVLALDPGRTTGYAIAARGGGKFDICYGEENWDHRDFWHALNVLQAELIVCESFEFRQGKQLGVDLYPCELIGVLNLWSQQGARYGQPTSLGYTPEIHYQPASVQSKRKAYFSDAMLKNLGLYWKDFEHGRSAVKHLLYWFQFGPGARFAADVSKAQLADEEWFRRTYL